MRESFGERDVVWTCYWSEAGFYELTFKYEEDLTAFKIMFGL